MTAPASNRKDRNREPAIIGHKLDQIKLPRNTNLQLYVEMPAHMNPERISLITLVISLTRIFIISSIFTPIHQKVTDCRLQ